jgi:hypothetical protein
MQYPEPTEPDTGQKEFNASLNIMSSTITKKFCLLVLLNLSKFAIERTRVAFELEFKDDFCA